MILASPGAVAFQILGFEVYWYGIIMAFAILVGTYTADWAYRKYFPGNDKELMFDLIPWLALVGFVGARLYYCILNYHYYLTRPFVIFNVREGGLSIHGALLACMIFLIVYAKKNRLKFFDLTASLTLGLALAQSIGRWGNFFNSEAFGKPFESGLIKLFIPEALRPLKFRSVEYFHPTFLYESILDFIIFLILFSILKKNNNSLFITSLYFALYSVVRIVVETIRIDSVVNINGIPIAIIVSVLILIFAIMGIIKSCLDKKNMFR